MLCCVDKGFDGHCPLQVLPDELLYAPLILLLLRPRAALLGYLSIFLLLCLPLRYPNRYILFWLELDPVLYTSDTFTCLSPLVPIFVSNINFRGVNDHEVGEKSEARECPDPEGPLPEGDSAEHHP